MADRSVKDAIAEALKDDRSELASEYTRVVQALRGLASDIEATLSPSEGAIEVRVEPGHRVNLGQQFNLVLTVPKAGLRDFLLRAYVPVDGLPVTLDLFEGESPTCDTVEAMQQQVIAFLKDPNVKQRLLALKDVAA